MIVVKDIHEFFSNEENIGCDILAKVGRRTVSGRFEGLIGNDAVAIVVEHGSGVKMPVAIWGVDWLSAVL